MPELQLCSKDINMATCTALTREPLVLGLSVIVLKVYTDNGCLGRQDAQTMCLG